MDAQTIGKINSAIGGIQKQLGAIQGILNGLNSPNGGIWDNNNNYDNNSSNTRYYSGFSKKNEISKKDFDQRAGRIKAIGDAVANFGEAIVEVYYTLQRVDLQKRVIEIGAASDVFVQNMALASKAISTATKGILITDPKAVVQQTLDNLKGAIELSTQKIKTENQKNLIEQQKRIDIQKAENEKINSMVNLGVAGALAVLAAFNPVTLGAVAVIAGFTALVKIGKKWYQSSLKYEVEKQELEKNIIEKQQKAQEQLLETMDNATKEWVDKSQAIIDANLKLNDEAHKLGRMFGFVGNGMALYEKNMVNVNIAMAKFGKGIEEYVKLQMGYSDRTGRYGLLSESDIDSMNALGSILGLNENETAGIAGGMQIFNKGAKESAETVWEMSQTAQMMGLSSQKFAKDLEKNLKLAQKYDFKNGTRGLMEMMRYAQSVRMDMAQMDAILSGFHTGNIEDVITKAAQLNVLGGNAALISDPIGMLYDAYANPQGMLSRVVQSISGMGFFNTNTGETEFGIAERMRIEQMAKAFGVSSETLTEMARQENKGRELNRLYGPNAFGKYGDLVKQTAFFEDGEWKVNVMGKGGKLQSMSLNAMQGNEKLLSEIMPNSAEEQLVTFAQKQLSVQEQIAATISGGKANVGADTYDDTVAAYTDINESMRIEWETFRKDYGDITRNILTKAQEQQRLLTEINIEELKDTINRRLTIALNDFTNLMVGTNAKIGEINKILRYYDNNVSKAAGFLSETMDEHEYQEDYYNIHRSSQNPSVVNAEAQIRSIEDDGMSLSPQQKGYLIQLHESLANYTPQQPIRPKDCIVLPGGRLVEPDENDFNVLMQEGGKIHQMMGGSQSDTSNTPRSVNVSGSLYLNTDGQSVDLVELINQNPDAFYRVATNILFPNQGQSRVNV